MKNLYEIRGDVTAIFLNRDLETLISTKDLDKVCSYPGTWTAYPGGRGKFYVQARISGAKSILGTKKHVKLARFIMDEPSGIVDHKNKDTLDNTRGNLRVTDEQGNRYNSEISINNNSGYTGVIWDKHEGKWKAYIYHNRKCIFLGYYKEKEKAIEARKRAEREYIK